MRDPNPLTAGKSLAKLRRAGIDVTVGVLRDEAARLNAAFVKHVTTGLPYVVMKAALTLDGRVATRTGHAEWITSKAARTDAHRWRGWCDAIVVGVGTVLADDPALTNRLGPKSLPSPTRVVLDPTLRTPPGAKLLRGPSRAGVWIVATPDAPKSRARKLEAAGAEVLSLPATKSGALSWKRLLRELGKRDVTSLLVEGGPGVWTGAHAAGVVDLLSKWVEKYPICSIEDGCSEDDWDAWKLLTDALGHTEWNQKEAAALLGLSYDQFRHLYRKYGLAKLRG